MFDRALRLYARSVVRDVPLPKPFSVKALCRELAVRNGRRIYLHPYPPEIGGEDMPCGVWVATASADHIFFERNTSEYHQRHIIMHEIAHMLCRHTVHDLADSMPEVHSLVAGRPQGALLRTSYTTRQEREAELVASMILERAMVWDSNTATAGERYFGEVLGFG